MKPGLAGHRAASGERGAGLVALLGAAVAFLALMLLSTQALINLYAASIVTSAAHEAARAAAVAPPDGAAARAAGEARARHLLGALAHRLELDWSTSDEDTVRLRVAVDAPRFGWPGLQARLGFDRIERSVQARVERPR